jgi:hypothetical protein
MRFGTLRHFVLAASIGAGLVSQALADPAITATPSAMHRAPNPHSGVVQAIPANAQIDLQNCEGDWCYASWRNRFGWIPAFAVSEGGPPPGAYGPPPVGYAPPPVVVAPPIVVAPTFGWGGPYYGGGWGYGYRRW